MSIPEQIDAIKERHDEYYRNEDALQEAIAVWGAEGQVNKGGVFADYREETVARAGRAVAEVGIHKVREGVFVHSCSYSSAAAGFGYAPSVWCSIPHGSEKEARDAGITELLQRIGDGASSHEVAAREEVRQLRQQLRQQIEQPSLF